MLLAAALDEALRDRGDVVEARTRARRLAALAPDRPSPPLQLFPGFEAWHNDRLDEARDAYGDALSAFADDDRIPVLGRLHLAALEAYAGRPEDAVRRAAEAAAAAAERDAGTWEAYARWQEALARRVLEGDAAAYDAALAAVAEELDGPLRANVEALRDLERARAGDESVADFGARVAPRFLDQRAAAAFEALILGELARARGDAPAAVSRLERAVALSPGLAFETQPSLFRPAVARAALAAAYEDAGEPEAALRTWRSLTAGRGPLLYAASIADVQALRAAEAAVARLASEGAAPPR